MPEPHPKTLVFVYGTLRAGQRTHPLLGSSRFVGRAQTQDRLRLLDIGAFPAVATHAADVPIQGEVYDVDEATLARLDRLEGVPHLYQRQTRPVDLRDGSAVMAAIYVWARDDADQFPLILSGDWLAR